MVKFRITISLLCFQVHDTKRVRQPGKFSSLNHSRMEGGRDRRPSSSPLQSPFPFGTPITNSDRSLLSPGDYNGHASESQVSSAGNKDFKYAATLIPSSDSAETAECFLFSRFFKWKTFIVNIL